ncbi:MAG TPA: BatA domain-containing protein [Verrucomicrobiales bacterium]|jgi:GNAT superfamily N-acetyltransferase|nr:BatA domain-containing protein [Verrucomicrobiales bacterium]
MNFLSPLFLLGALAIAAPVIFHLIRRTTKDRQRFGSLMFLSPTPPRLTKRSRIEHWLLLLLRAMALALLALAFARPFFRAKTLPGDAGKGGDRTVVLLDVSASLRREGLWEDAKARALAAVEEAASGGDVAMVIFDRAARPLLKFEDWHQAVAEARMGLAKDRLASVTPSWSGTGVASGLMAAAEMLAESGSASAGRHSVVLVTDAQEGSRLEALQGYDWPKGVKVRIQTVSPKRPGNAGLQLAAGDADPVPGARLRVSNSADAQGESFQVGWQGANGEFEGKAMDVYAPPGQNRIVILPWPQGGAKSGKAMLRGDVEAFDNLVSVAQPPVVTVPVIHSGGGPESPGALYFLQKALPAGRSLTATARPYAPGIVPSADVLKTTPLWVITDSLQAPVASAAETYAAGGGTVLIMLASTEMAPTLQTITGADRVPLTEVKPPSYALLGTIDFTHPLFSAFAEPRFSDFTKIRFWNYRRLDPSSLKDASVVARFDSSDPAVVEVKRGKGRVFILTSGWQPSASQLALSSKFPSLLGSLLASTGAGAPMPSQFFAGEPVPVSSLLPASIEKATVHAPDGTSSSVERGGTFAGFTAPGWYRVVWDGGQREVAVNLDPAESRTMPLAVEEFEKLGTPVAGGVSGPSRTDVQEESVAAEESEGRQKIWRWILAAVFAVLFIETLLGTRTARRYSTVEGGSIA